MKYAIHLSRWGPHLQSMYKESYENMSLIDMIMAFCLSLSSLKSHHNRTSFDLIFTCHILGGSRHW